MTFTQGELERKLQQARNLFNDDAYQEIVADVKDKLVANVFLNPSSTVENRDEAFGVVKAFEMIDRHIQSLENSVKVAEKLAKK